MANRGRGSSRALQNVSPKRKRSDASIKQIDDVEYQELVRGATALSLAKSKRKDAIGHDPKITHIPKQKLGKKGYVLANADDEHSMFAMDPRLEPGKEPKLFALCHTLDGRGPEDECEKNQDEFEVELLQEVVRMAVCEVESIAEAFELTLDEARGRGIKVSDDDYYELRDSYFNRQDQTPKGKEHFKAERKAADKKKLFELLRKGRRELAWHKDNRDFVIDYIDMAVEFDKAGIKHSLTYAWYTRVPWIEGLQNDLRYYLRLGERLENTEKNQSEDATGGKKRRIAVPQDISINDEMSIENEIGSAPGSSTSEEAKSTMFDADALMRLTKEDLVRIILGLYSTPGTLPQISEPRISSVAPPDEADLSSKVTKGATGKAQSKHSSPAKSTSSGSASSATAQSKHYRPSFGYGGSRSIESVLYPEASVGNEQGTKVLIPRSRLAVPTPPHGGLERLKGKSSVREPGPSRQQNSNNNLNEDTEDTEDDSDESN